MATTPTTTSGRLTRGYRWGVAGRSLLALFGGFLWVSVFGAFVATSVSQLGWMPRAQAVYIMTMFSFVPWCALALWIFYEPRLRRSFLGMLASGLLLYGLTLTMKTLN